MPIYSMAGAEVEQVTLAGNLPYTLPVGLAPNSVHHVVFTQDATGGHTVTYSGQPVAVDLTAGASTVVELHPIAGGYVVRYWPTPAAVAALPGGGSSTIAADDTPAAPAEGKSASYLVTPAVTWPAGLVWSTDPDGGVAPTVTGTALVSLFTVGGVTRAIMGAAFPAVVPESPLANAILALSPVGYWKLDETAGTQATDYSGNARHGTYGGNYTLAANGGLVTLGATGYVDCGDADEWSYAGAADGFTVFALATRPSIPSSASAFLGKRGNGNAEWMAYLSGGANAGKMTFGGYTIDSSKVCTEERAGSAVTAIGSWNAYTFVAQPPAQNARIAMYENGTLLTSSNVGGTASMFSNGTASLRIGGIEYSGWGSNTFLPWNGSIGHVAVFRSTLTAGQVATLAAAAATEGLI